MVKTFFLSMFQHSAEGFSKSDVLCSDLVYFYAMGFMVGNSQSSSFSLFAFFQLVLISMSSLISASDLKFSMSHLERFYFFQMGSFRAFMSLPDRTDNAVVIM